MSSAGRWAQICLPKLFQLALCSAMLGKFMAAQASESTGVSQYDLLFPTYAVEHVKFARLEWTLHNLPVPYGAAVASIVTDGNYISCALGKTAVHSTWVDYSWAFLAANTNLSAGPFLNLMELMYRCSLSCSQHSTRAKHSGW